MFKLFTLALFFFSTQTHAEKFPSRGVWIDQRALTADYSFSALIDSSDNERGAVKAVRIANRRSGAVLQEIEITDSVPTLLEPDSAVSIVDANFDGVPDFMIPCSDGGAGPNNSNNYYLFDTKTEVFSISAELSDLPQPSINSDKTISSAFRDGCCHHGSATYRFLNGKLTLVADWDEAYTPDGWVETTTGRLKNGKWVFSMKRKRADKF